MVQGSVYRVDHPALVDNFASGVICTHVLLEGKISLLPVVLNRTFNSNLNAPKVLTKGLSSLPLLF